MDSQVRQPISRAPSNLHPGQPSYSNMASYAVQYPTSQPHLPPIQSQQTPQVSQAPGYLPQQYRSEPARYPATTSAAPYSSERGYSFAHGPPQATPGSSLLPQPSQSYAQSHSYSNTPPTSVSQAYPQRIAPAPPRDRPGEMGHMAAAAYPPGDARALWASGENGPNAGDAKDQRSHVVGSQGRRGILPSAPGRTPAAPNGMNGAAKSNAIPPKDADGKFPCPNCNKTYLHAKHLKRHLLRHTGDRPYMCVLCKDTFSRSDILKRHFQKCSIRRGNPTGASHLSSPAAHIKKHNAQQKAAAEAAAATSGTSTPNSGVNGTYPTASASMANPPTYSEGPSIPYSMAASAPNVIHRTGPEDQFHQSSTSGGWNQFSNAKHNPMLYQSNASPDHFAVNASHADEKRSDLPAQAHHPGEEWHMFPPGQGDGYMNTMFQGSLAPSYESIAAHAEVKKPFEAHEGPSNPYYIANNINADGNAHRAK